MQSGGLFNGSAWMKRMLFTQTHPHWRNLPRYHEQSAEQLEALDEAIQACIKYPNKKNKDIAKDAACQFIQAVEVLIDEGFKPGRRQNYSVELYGCWDCCMAMIMSDHNIFLYEYGQRRRLLPNPANLITTLSSWQIMSPIGYAYDLIIDPIVVITRSRLQLFVHQDYGEEGVGIGPLRESLMVLSRRQGLSVVVAVKGHPIFGDKETTHWVVLHTTDSDKTRHLMMRDPRRQKIDRFCYRKIYVLCVYSAASQKRPSIPKLN